MKKRVLCLVMVFAMLLPTLVVSANAYSTSMPQGIQLFTGPKDPYGGTETYKEYTDADIEKLVGICSEFIINCINGPINYDLDGNAIITTDILNNMNPSYVFSGTTKASLVNTYSSMLSDYSNGAKTYANLKVLADAQIELANRLIAEDPSVSIWFSFPFITYFPCALEYVDPFTDYANYIKNEMATRKWNNNVRGFYWSTESIGWSAAFTSAASNNFGNPHVMLMDIAQLHVRKSMANVIYLCYHRQSNLFLYKNSHLPFVTSDCLNFILFCFYRYLLCGVGISIGKILRCFLTLSLPRSEGSTSIRISLIFSVSSITLLKSKGA